MEPITACAGFEAQSLPQRRVEGFFASSRADQPTRSRFEIVNRFKFLSLSGVGVASTSWEPCAEPTRIGNYVDDQSAGMTWPRWSPHTDSAVSAAAAHLTTGRDPSSCLASLPSTTSLIPRHCLINEYSSSANELCEDPPARSPPTIGIVFVSLINVIRYHFYHRQQRENYHNGCRCGVLCLESCCSEYAAMQQSRQACTVFGARHKFKLHYFDPLLTCSRKLQASE